MTQYAVDCSYNSKTLSDIVVTNGKATEVEVKLQKREAMTLMSMVAEFANSTHRTPIDGLIEPSSKQ